MYPHERSLVKRYAGRPFALLGVNSDPDREALKKRIREEKISWRSWFAGGVWGKIPVQWNVSGWPTLYLLDHKGVIRAKDVRQEQQLDAWIERLVREAEADAKRIQKKPPEGGAQ